MAHVRRAISADIAFLAPKMRQADRDEIKASDNIGAAEALMTPFQYTGHRTWSVIGTDEEYVIGMFGSVPTLEPDYGVAWLLSSDELFNYKKEFIRQSPEWVAQMGKNYKYLYNWVDCRNTKSIKWLKHLGFKEIQREEQYGKGKMPFYLMMKEIICVV